MTDKTNTLFITDSAPIEGTEYQHTFIINQEKKNLNESELNNLAFRLQRLSTTGFSGVPLYDLLSFQLWYNTRNRFGGEIRKMYKLILLYEEIENKIDEHNINQIICEGVNDNIYTLIQDICDEKNIGLTSDKSLSKVYSRIEVIKALFKSFSTLFILFIDQLFALLLGRLSTSITDSDLAVMFPVMRPKTFSPLYDHIDHEFDTIYTLRTLGYVSKYHSVIPDSANIRFLQASVNIKTILSELKIVGMIYYECFYAHAHRNKIAEKIYNKEDVNIVGLIQRLYPRTILYNIDAIFAYILASNFFEQNDYEKLLVPGIARTSRGLSYAAINKDIDLFHLPHGIGSRDTPHRNIPHTRFTSGKLHERYIKTSRNESINPVPTGTLKHQTILKKRSKLSEEIMQNKSKDTVLLATQPYPDRIREEFINDVVGVILDSTEYHIIIKPHPGEDVQYYERMIDMKYNPTEIDRIKIDKSELYKKMYVSELLITIDSNTAIESVIMGTPALAYNRWSHEIENHIYTKYGSIPSCSSCTELRRYLSGYDYVDSIQEQKQMLKEDYMVYENSAACITQKIRSEIGL